MTRLVKNNSDVPELNEVWKLTFLDHKPLNREIAERYSVK